MPPYVAFHHDLHCLAKYLFRDIQNERSNNQELVSLQTQYFLKQNYPWKNIAAKGHNWFPLYDYMYIRYF